MTPNEQSTNQTDTDESGIGRGCDLCDNEAVTTMPVSNEDTGEVRDANLCSECQERTHRYDRGEEVDWSEVLE